MRTVLVLSFLLLCGAAVAAPPKAVPQKPAAAKDTRPRIDQLFAQLAKAESPEDAKPIVDKIAAEFRASGSPSVDLLMARATVTVETDKAVARRLVESVTRIAPRYAEGWRARAAMEAAAGDDTAALVSLQKAVQLNPRHFIAMGELGNMLEDYGEKPGALKLYRRALALNPQMENITRKIRELTQAVEGRDI